MNFQHYQFKALCVFVEEVETNDSGKQVPQTSVASHGPDCKLAIDFASRCGCFVSHSC